MSICIRILYHSIFRPHHARAHAFSARRRLRKPTTTRNAHHSRRRALIEDSRVNAPPSRRDAPKSRQAPRTHRVPFFRRRDACRFWQRPSAGAPPRCNAQRHTNADADGPCYVERERMEEEVDVGSSGSSPCCKPPPSHPPPAAAANGCVRRRGSSERRGVIRRPWPKPRAFCSARRPRRRVRAEHRAFAGASSRSLRAGADVTGAKIDLRTLARALVALCGRANERAPSPSPATVNAWCSSTTCGSAREKHR